MQLTNCHEARRITPKISLTKKTHHLLINDFALRDPVRVQARPRIRILLIKGGPSSAVPFHLPPTSITCKVVWDSISSGVIASRLASAIERLQIGWVS